MWNRLRSSCANGLRLHAPLRLRIQRGDADADAHQVLASHPREQIEVAQHQRALGDDGERMAAAGEHLGDVARDAPAPLEAAGRARERPMAPQRRLTRYVARRRHQRTVHP